MNALRGPYLVLLFCLLTFGCGQKESISPSFETKQSTGQSYRFNISRSDAIDSPTLEFSQIGPIGGVVQNLADAIADLMLSEDETVVPLDPVVFYLPELQNFDLDMIEDVALEKVLVKTKNAGDQSDLKFIKNIEVYIDYGHDLPQDARNNNRNNETDSIGPDEPLRNDIILGGEIPEDAELVLSYDRTRESLHCLARCLDMTVHPIDFKALMDMRYTSYTIHLRLVIDGIPKGVIELETLFDIKVDADLFK